MTDDDEEQAYMRGERSAWLFMLTQCLRHLGQPERDAEAWRLERGAAIVQLREVCAIAGDNDWSDDLHLGDVIEKHLGRYLDD